jgi:hypothetical protein
LDFYYPHDNEWQALRDLLDNPERVDALLAAMKPIYDNTIPDDRYYNIRKTAFENLTAYKNGDYTLFPGLEQLPEPDTMVARRFDLPVRQAGEPRREREQVINLSNSPFGGDFSFAPTPSVQMSMFDVSPLPILPNVDEQRAKIDGALKEEAKSIEQNADAPFLAISDADKARIAAQFAAASRSREAVSLVNEIYGDTLGMPLPQAIKRITELVTECKFTAPELTDA